MSDPRPKIVTEHRDGVAFLDVALWPVGRTTLIADSVQAVGGAFPAGALLFRAMPLPAVHTRATPGEVLDALLAARDRTVLYLPAELTPEAVLCSLGSGLQMVGQQLRWGPGHG